jgi:hypothetical protein
MARTTITRETRDDLNIWRLVSRSVQIFGRAIEPSNHLQATRRALIHRGDAIRRVNWLMRAEGLNRLELNRGHRRDDKGRMHRTHLRKVPFPLWICVALLALAGSAPVRAEMGPCRPDGHESLICGTGDGAARVVEETVSPSKRLALAWRSTSHPPTERPSLYDPKDLEDLVVRLGDGAILARHEGEYWSIPDGGHANRLTEQAVWSPDSRLMIATLEERFDTSMVDLYGFDAHDKLTGPFNLLGIMEPALRSRLKQSGKDAAAYLFDGAGRRSFTIDNRGRVHGLVMMWVPKDGPFAYFEMTIQVIRKGGALDAKILSVRRSRKEL